MNDSEAIIKRASAVVKSASHLGLSGAGLGGLAGAYAGHRIAPGLMNEMMEAAIRNGGEHLPVKPSDIDSYWQKLRIGAPAIGGLAGAGMGGLAGAAMNRTPPEGPMDKLRHLIGRR